MNNPKTVMVIEDEPFLRDTICEVLTDAGHAALAMADGTEAMEYLCSSRSRPDVILLDLMMPGMDGWQFRETQLLVAGSALIPVVVMTSARDLKNIQVDEVILKPFDADRLLGVIERLGDDVTNGGSGSVEVGSAVSETGDQETASSRFEESFSEDPDQSLLDQAGNVEEAIHLHDTFLGIVCHDLRNPLNAITMAASQLKRKNESEEFSVPLRRILLSARQMQRMISQLLDFTRTQTGRQMLLKVTGFDLAELARTTVAELKDVFNNEIRVGSDNDTAGTWDRERLSDLIASLVKNACQHGLANSPVDVLIDGTAPETVRIVVRNRGGISKSLLPYLFDPMRRALDNIPKSSGSGGVGLGLYVSREIVLAHGGSIKVRSSVHGGTEFSAVLPRNVVPKGQEVVGAHAKVA